MTMRYDNRQCPTADWHRSCAPRRWQSGAQKYCFLVDLSGPAVNSSRSGAKARSQPEPAVQSLSSQGGGAGPCTADDQMPPIEQTGVFSGQLAEKVDHRLGLGVHVRTYSLL